MKGRELWYREPLFTYRKGVWPWNTLEASSSSESGADFSGMSTSAFGVSSNLLCLEDSCLKVVAFEGERI